MLRADKLKEQQIIGTHIWYLYICKRQVWFSIHQIAPFDDNPHLELGRFIHEHGYKQKTKKIRLENMEIDLIDRDSAQNTKLIGEIKKSSWNQKSALMQLAFYLNYLEQYGIIAEGELLVPKEKKRFPLKLTEELRAELQSAKERILEIAELEKPPETEWVPFCKNCAYRELCWA